MRRERSELRDALFEQAVLLPPWDRSRWLHEHCPDQALCVLLESLLEFGDESEPARFGLTVADALSELILEDDRDQEKEILDDPRS